MSTSFLGLAGGLDWLVPTEGAVNSQPSAGRAVILDQGQEESPASQAIHLLLSEGWVGFSWL